MQAVVFTDMVGSTQLRSRLGDSRADDLHHDHDALLTSVVASHGGRVLRHTGDGFKLGFDTASAAVSAAIEMQRAVARYGRNPTAVSGFQIRIGIAVGEVTIEGNAVRGLPVIEAARLEAIASPGEILATELVGRLAQRRVDAAFEDLGPHTLKGIDEPVPIARVVDTAPPEATRSLPRTLSADRRFPLVGRADVVRTVARRWDDVRLGAAATVLVAGRAGMGKSRVLAEVGERAQADGALVLAGLCDSDLAVPYEPFAQAFADAPDDEELAAALATGAGALGPLFPARRGGRFDDTGPAARFELFDAVVGLLDRLATGRPVVLVLEDLHWATPPTVHLLRHLLRQLGERRVLVLGSYRADEVGPSHPLRDLLEEARTSTAVARVELAALELADVVGLVSARVPQAPADRVDTFARRALQESGGSPFFVCELLHHLSTTGELARLVDDHLGAELPIPDSVREVVGQRVARLPAGVGDLLTTAAVVGLGFDLELLAAVTARPVDDVLDTLEEAERFALVQEVGVGRFAFGHAIVRNTLLDGLRATRRALSHRRVAEAIEALGRPDHDELAHHWGLAGVEAKAVANLELAARRDLGALAYESAAERYEQVLEHHRRAGDPDLHALARAWLGFGLARRAAGHADFAAAIAEAGRLGRKLRDTEIVVEAAIASLWPGTFFVTPGLTQTGSVALLEDALRLLAPDDVRRARLLCTLAGHLTYDDDRPRRIALLAEARATTEAIGDPEQIGSVAVAEYLTLWDPTTAARRAEIAVEVATMAASSGAADLEFFASFFAAIGAAERADLAEAHRQLDGVTAAVAATRNFYFGFLADRLRTSLHVLVNRPDAQRAVDELAQRYSGTYADTPGTWALQTGGLAVQRGRLGDLVAAIEALLVHSELGDTWRSAYGLALYQAGDRAGAEAVLDAFVAPPLDFFWLTVMQIYGELAAQLGRRDVVDGVYDALLPFRDQLGITASGSLCLGLVATTLGELALARDDPTVARDLLLDAVERADRMAAPFEQVRTRRLLVEALRAISAPVHEIDGLLDVASGLARTHGFDGEIELLTPLEDEAARRRTAELRGGAFRS